MIGRLTGTLVEKQPPTVCLDVNGVGYELDVPMSTLYSLPELGARVTLLTHLAIREDAHVLYGFGTAAERVTFRELIKVSGVGARIALAVLSGVTVEEFARMVQAGDITALTRIPGIGKKTAERMVLELRDRAAQFGAGGALPTGSGPAPADPLSDATVALQQLGYKPAEAARMARDAFNEGDEVATVIRKALQSALR